MEQIEIKSYRAVFELERRIYRIDRFRLNPAGVPVRGVAYFTAIICALLLIGRLPIVHPVLWLLPWYLRMLVLPACLAALTTGVEIDGRRLHRVLPSLLRYATGPRQLNGLESGSPQEWRPPELVTLVDGSDTRLRCMRCCGPGLLLIDVAHTRRDWQLGRASRLLHVPDVTLSPLDASPPRRRHAIELNAGTRLEVSR